MRIKETFYRILKHSSVTTQITLVAIGILLALIVTFVIIDYQVQRHRVINELERYSNQFSRAVEGSLALGMITMRRDLLQGTIEQLTDDEAVDRVFLLDNGGRVAASTDIETIDTIIPTDHPGCKVCHTPGRTPQGIALIKEGDGKSYYRSVRPVLNREACQRCHDPEQEINGLLVIDYNASFLTAQVQDAWQRVTLDITLLTLAAMPVLIVVISMTVRRYLLHPMRKLESLAVDIAHGNFPTEIKPELRGDVAQLGNVLIDMSHQLEESFEKLRSARDYMDRMIDSIEDGLIVIDKDFKVTNINPSALKLTSKSRADIVRNSCHEVCLCHGATELCPARKVYEQQSTVRVETSVEYDDKPPRWFEIQASPLFNGNGDVVEVVEVIRDITTRRELELNLAHKDRLSAMGRLAASVAHEINTPLGTIMTCIEGLLRDLKRAPEMSVSDWNDLNPYLQTMLASVQRGRKIVQRLLVYVRRDEKLFTVDVDINKVIIESLEMLRHESRTAGVKFDVKLDENLPAVKSDPTQLSQVIINFLQNSVDAIENDGTVTIITWREDCEVVISVEDDGAGIPPEHHLKVFEPFFTTKEVGVGTGLGLFLCREIVEQHGGTITWESLPQGAVFSVRLPIRETEAA